MARLVLQGYFLSSIQYILALSFLTVIAKIGNYNYISNYKNYSNKIRAYKMNFTELAKSRYTTKKYNPEKKVGENEIKQLKEILRLSPSSINSQPWRFIFVSDADLKNALAEVSYFNEQKIKDASHIIIFSVINNLNHFEKQIREKLPEGSVAYYNKFLKPQPDESIKSWLAHQVYISLGFFLSACAAMGIDATPMEGIQTDKYDGILHLDSYTTLFAVAIGYRDNEDANQPLMKPKTRLNLEEVVQPV
jgi:nitroreductase/dihydropteridine reductase